MQLALLLEAATRLSCQALQRHEANVVACTGVFVAGVTKAHQQLQGGDTFRASHQCSEAQLRPLRSAQGKRWKLADEPATLRHSLELALQGARWWR